MYMKIRRAKISDIKEIKSIQQKTIKYINSKDYNKKQISAWLDYNKIKNIRKRLKNKKRNIFVILDKNKIVGFGSLKIEENKLSGLYIKHDIIGKGIGSKLLRYIESFARRKGIKRLKLYSTLTAYDFYKKKGYKKIRRTHQLMNKVKLPCILMSKKL